MSRPKFARYGITIGDVLDFIEGLLEVTSLVDITGEPRGCQDPDDDAVIETAEVGAVDYLITGDSDLQAGRVRAGLNKLGIEVVTARSFLRDNLALTASGALALDQARMIVAAQVGSAIAVSAWQLNSIKTHLESLQYDFMISRATINRRVAQHRTELEYLSV